MSMQPPDFSSLPDDLEQHREFLNRIALQLVGPDQADDLVQETYLAALEHPPAKLRSPRAWLTQVLRNRRARRWREESRRSYREQRVARDEAQAADDSAEQLELVQQVAAAVQALPPHYREVVYRSTYLGESPRRMANQLQLPIETVYSRLKRGRSQLQERLDRDYGGERGQWTRLLVPLLPPMAMTPPGPAPSTSPAPAAHTPHSLPLAPLAIMGSKLALGAALTGALVFALLQLRSKPAPPPTPLAGATPSSQPGQASTPRSPAEGSLQQPGWTITRTIGAEHGAGAESLAGLSIWVSFERASASAAGLTGTLLRQGTVDRSLALDQEGSAELEGLEPGTCALALPGRGEWPVTLVSGATAELHIRIPLGVAVSGQVVDGAGMGISGAELFLADSEDIDGRGRLGHADRSGRFNLDGLAPWSSSGPDTVIAARAPGYITSDARAVAGQPGATTEIKLELQGPAGTLNGDVRDAAGRPVPGALVEFEFRALQQDSEALASQDGLPRRQAPKRSVRTDEQGRFRAERLPLGSCQVLVVAEDQPQHLQDWTIEAPSSERLAIQLAPSGSLRGLVLDEGKAPLAGRMVSVRHSSPDEKRYRHTWTDAAGLFVVSGLPAGRAEVSVFGMTSQSVEIAPEEVAQLEFREHPTLSLQGRLIGEAGEALIGYLISAVDPAQPNAWLQSDRSQEDGGFAFQGIEDRELAIAVHAPDVFSSPRLLLVDWPSPEEPGETYDLVLPDERRPSAGLQCRVASPDPASLDTIGAVLRSEDSTWQKQIPMGRDGLLGFDSLLPGSYSLEVAGQGMIAQVIGGIVLAPRGIHDLGTVQLSPGGTLTVQAFLASSGEPAQGAFVQVTGSRGESWTLGWDEQQFRSPTLPAGDYLVHANGVGFAYQSLPARVVEGRDQALVVHLEPGTARHLRLDPPLPEGELAKLRVVSLQGAVVMDTSKMKGSSLLVSGLGPGTWRAILETQDGARAETAFTIRDLEEPWGSEVLLQR